MVAKNEKLSKLIKYINPSEMPTQLMVNLDIFTGFDTKDIGELCTATITARVSRISKSEDARMMTLDVEEITQQGGSKGGADYSTQEDERGNND